MKQNKYSIMDQLKKTPIRIFLFSLIMSSETPKKALQKILNEAYVALDITTGKLGKLAR